MKRVSKGKSCDFYLDLFQAAAWPIGFDFDTLQLALQCGGCRIWGPGTLHEWSSEISPSILFLLTTNDLLCLFTNPHFSNCSRTFTYLSRLYFRVFHPFISKLCKNARLTEVGESVLTNSFPTYLFSAYFKTSLGLVLLGLLSQSKSKKIMIVCQMSTPYLLNEVCMMPL